MLYSSNNYKRSLKRLRKNNNPLNEREKRSPGNYYKYLSKLEQEPEEEEPEEEEPEEEECIEIVREKRDTIDYNDLPEDTKNIILGFLPYNTRIAVLKYKYNRNFIKYKLQKMPETNEILAQMWVCANIANNLLKSLLNNNSDILKNNSLSSYSIMFFKDNSII
jgi:predicted nuclease with TOPRIM domain